MDNEQLFDNEKHFCKCGLCQEIFDMRDLGKVMEHEHEDLPELKHNFYGTQPPNKMTEQQKKLQIRNNLAKGNGFRDWDSIIADYNKGFTSAETLKALMDAADLEYENQLKIKELTKKL